MILPWDSDSGTCPGPAEQIPGETFPETLHMSLPHSLPRGVRRGKEGKGGKRWYKEG